MLMPGLVTEHEASVILGLSVRTLQKWRLQGNGPRFVKLGHAVRYDPAELKYYIDRARRRSTSDPGSNQVEGRRLPHRA
jgi:predicted DNA-binding transcriptional regulator AlpA